MTISTSPSSEEAAAARAATVRSVFGAIRTAAFSTKPEALMELKTVLLPQTATFLDRIVAGNASPADGSVEGVAEILSAFQIPVETAVPLWPPPQLKEPIGEALAAAAVDGACEAQPLDEFFLRLRAIKQVFAEPDPSLP